MKSTAYQQIEKLHSDAIQQGLTELAAVYNAILLRMLAELAEQLKGQK